MGQRNRSILARTLVVAALAMSGAARADEAPNPDTLGTPEAEEPEGPNRGRVKMSLSSDITNAYFFRGILNERHGFIWQPSADLSVNLYTGDGFVRSVSAAFGMWASFQTEQTLARHGGGPANLYEVDYYPYVTVGLPYGLETSLSYILYTSPNGAFATVQQMDWGTALDDSEWLGDFALHPAVTFSFELQNTSFGDQEGGYFELALAPTHDFKFAAAEDYPLTLTLPLALGLSLYDYYETPTSDHTFGFFSFGLSANVPLAFIPSDFGSWSTGASITGLALSDTLADANEGDSLYPVGVWNISMEY